MSRIEEQVCNIILGRADGGEEKYGVTMERDDLSIPEWLTHAQEEAMDLSIYLEKLKEEIPKLLNRITYLEGVIVHLEAEKAVLIANQN